MIVGELSEPVGRRAFSVTDAEHLFSAAVPSNEASSVIICAFIIARLSKYKYKHVHFYLRIENAEGYVMIAVYLFIHLFICMRVIRITQKVLNRIA